MSNDNPTQETSVSPMEATGAVNQMDQIDLERKAETDLEEFAAAFVGEHPQNEPEEIEPVAQESEDDSDEEIELSEDDADVESPDEVDEETEVDESADHDLEILDYDEWSKYALEIGGKTYTGSQLKSALGRLESAGKNAREADQLRKDYETKVQELAAKEKAVDERLNATTSVDTLAQINLQAQNLQAQMEQARQEGDAYQLTMLKDAYDNLGRQYVQAKTEVDNAKAAVEHEKLLKAEQGLIDRGLKYLTENSPQAKAWNEFASSLLSPEEVEIAAHNPGLAEALELARKYKTATNKKAKKQLKTSGKTLRPGQNPSSKPKKQAYSGEVEYFQLLARDLLGS